MPGVPNAFVTFSDTLLDLSLSHCLLTPNERLAREYQIAHATAQHNAGREAWPTLTCMSLGRYLLSEYSRLQDLNLQCPRLLTRHELIGLAQGSAPAESSALIDTFLQAWETVARYEVDLNDPGFSHPRGHLFRQWHGAVSRELEQRTGQDSQGIVVEEQIGSLLAESELAPRMPLVLIDFDVITPAERRYLEQVASRIDVLRYDSLSDALHGLLEAQPSMSATSRLAEPKISSAEDLRREVAAAAAWAREHKLTHPKATIGIVVPTLAQDYDLVLRQVGAVLDPHQGSRSPSFDIAAGTRLAEQAIWQHARYLLACATAEFDADDLTRIADSPFLGLSYLSDVCASWPRRLRKTVRLEHLQAWVRNDHFDALLAEIATLPRHANVGTWSRHVLQILTAAGWPQQQALGSVQFQALKTIETLLGQFQADPDERRIDVAQALQRLDLRLGAQVFAPERPHADIQVLGMLETTGLSFDALWVCGLDEGSFPAKNLANPFVPRSVAQKYGVPRSSQQEELVFARTLLERWRRACRDGVVHFSYSSRGEDSEQLVSPLLREWSDRIDIAPDAPHPFARRGDAVLDGLFDHTGPPAKTEGMSGGTALLSAQAACPFKAFAEFRLKLRDPVKPGNFPDAMLRGTLLHDAMFHLVRENDNLPALQQLTRDDVQRFAADAVDRLNLPLATDFIPYEVERLTSLLLDWLLLEQAREPFSVIALEETYELELGGLRLRVRIDRMDSVDGHDLVIDYKTGNVTLRGLTERPLRDAQLPAYSLIHDAIEGVYYAQVRTDTASLHGAARAAARIEGARLADLAHDWDEQRNAWRRDLTSLARDFVQGSAQVAPRDGACEYCHLQSLCRIGEHDG